MTNRQARKTSQLNNWKYTAHESSYFGRSACARYIKQTVVIILGILFTQATTSCRSNDGHQYEIHGVVNMADMEGSLIYLAGLEGNTLVYADSTVIADSTFMFIGIQDKPRIKYLIPLRRTQTTYAPEPFILENGNIRAVIMDSGTYVSGTPLNDEFNMYRSKKADFRARKELLSYAYRDSLNKITEEKEEYLMAQYRSIERAEMEYVADIINKNNDNVFGGYVMLENRYMLSNAQKRKILDDASEDFFQLDGITSIAESLKRRNTLDAGRKLPDIELLDSRDGKMHLLSEYAGKGNFLIISFWASWSAPSIADIYNIRTLAWKYSSKGLGVLSISIDTLASDWQKAIRKNGMYWTNLADLKGWGSNVTAKYQINAIPNYMLVNSDGTIIMSEGTLDDIEEKLNRLLNN